MRLDAPGRMCASSPARKDDCCEAVWVACAPCRNLILGNKRGTLYQLKRGGAQAERWPSPADLNPSDAFSVLRHVPAPETVVSTSAMYGAFSIAVAKTPADCPG